MEAAAQIPAGYRENAKGALIPIQNIRQSDLVIDEFVCATAARWQELQQEMAKFKAALFADVSALLDLIAEKYQVKRGKAAGMKGNVQLMAYNGRYKLVVAVADTITFGPELQAAQQLISECLQLWTQDSGTELKTIVNAAFAVDAKGAVNVGRILSLRRYTIDSPQWRQAMAAIGDAIMVVGTKEYVRLYERDARGGYVPIPLDIAAL